MQKNNHFLTTKTNHIDIFSIGLLILFATNKFILKLYHKHELFFLSPLLSHRFNLKSTNNYLSKMSVMFITRLPIHS